MTIKLTPRQDRIRVIEAQLLRLHKERKVLLEAQTTDEMPPTHPDCGTPKGYKRHKHYGEAACDSCLDAHAAHQRSEYARSKLLRQAATPEFRERLKTYGRAS